MKVEEAAMMLRGQGWISRGVEHWHRDIPTGRFSLDYIFITDEWRASYRGLFSDSYLASNQDGGLPDALRWVELVEEEVSL